MSLRFRETAERASRGEVAAHSVHPAARWRRGRADEEPRVGGGIGVEPGDGPGEELPQIGDAARDRAADVIRIVRLEIPSTHDVAREDAVAEAGCEPLDLPLDGLGPIHRRPVGYVTVRVAGVLAPRRPGGVELALVDDEREWPLRMLAAQDGRDRRGEWPLERQDRMRRQPREQRARAIAAKTGTERPGGGEKPRQSEASQADRMLRDAQRAEEVGEQVVRCAQERREEAFVGAG